jgi:5-deoxy-glucuronate isomerase
VTARHIPSDDTGSVAVTPGSAGWSYAGLRILTLAAGARHTWHTGGDETVVLPLAGRHLPLAAPR